MRRLLSPLRTAVVGTTLGLALVASVGAAQNDTVILDEIGAKNLGLELAEAVEVDFEEVLFAIGRIEHLPRQHAVVSSRASGRVVEVRAIPGDLVERGDVLIRIESRVPGDPPPIVSLRAPISGMVVDQHVHVGEPVEPTDEMLDITNLTKVWAVARVPEEDAGRLEVGARARIRVAARPGRLFEGELVRFGATADPATGTLEAVFLLDNSERLLRPGMRAEFSIITSARKDVLAVPVDAVQGGPANQSVYVEYFELPYAYSRVPVQTGARNDQYVEIVRGLFPADRVVTKGAYFLGAAGSGTMSLKEALDLAHGHEHNEDGSEFTPEQEAERAATASRSTGGGDHSGPLTLFLGFSTVVLAILLVASSLRAARARSEHA